jgi:hypothetical protein
MALCYSDDPKAERIRACSAPSSPAGPDSLRLMEEYNLCGEKDG